MPVLYLNGLGATVDFATSGDTLEIVTLDQPERERPSEETTHLGSTEETAEPGGLENHGAISLEVHHDPEMTNFLGAAIEAITVNYPLRSGQTTPAKRQFNGFVTKQGGESFAKTGRITSKLEIMVANGWTEVAPT